MIVINLFEEDNKTLTYLIRSFASCKIKKLNRTLITYLKAKTEII